MIRITSGLATALTLLAPLRANADFHVVSPYEIDLGELEIEHNGSASFDRKPDNSGAQSYTIEFGTGLTSWWHSELELGFDRDPGFNEPTNLTQAVTENMFQLTEPGAQFADFGFYVEYGQSLTTGRHAAPNQVTFGPVIGMDIGRTTHIVNLFLTRELGPDQDTHGLDFSYRWQSRWNLWAPLSPAIEIYGDSGTLGRSPRFSQQQLLVGPVAVGALSLHDLGLGNAGKVKYEIGWLFGATQATAEGTLRWRLELEIPF
ncbi:MAG: hypothetical protein P4L90_23325 [Rhodopila sp.]|nr:hypothetical protein [Rhodopila sp.]